MSFSAADLAYVRDNYFTLEELCVDRVESPEQVRAHVARRSLPAPSYVLDDGTEMFPADYFALMDQAGGVDELRSHFESRHRAAGGPPDELEQDWQGYLQGLFAVCLRLVSPETIVRKERLVVLLGRLLAQPEPASERWRARVRLAVWELDALEREFAPDYDRGGRFEQPPTRDRLIVAARERFPELFDATTLVR